MIVKQRSFKVSSGTLYGFAGGVFGVVTIGLMIQSQFAPESYPACTERYAKAGIFAVKRKAGSLLTPAELQSRLAGQDWGVLQNLTIKADATLPNKVAMTVKFGAGGTANNKDRTADSGMGFKWRPSYLKNASAACLSYSVRLPKSFKFEKGGTLPGLTGEPAASNTKEEFSLRMRWLQGGKVGVQPITPKERDGRLLTLAGNWLKLPRDRWVSIEQEVVLNTPDKRDGALRIWIDGKLELNLADLSFRRDDKGRFAGVIVDTHYADGRMQWTPAPQATEIKLSPMIVRWN